MQKLRMQMEAGRGASVKGLEEKRLRQKLLLKGTDVVAIGSL